MFSPEKKRRRGITRPAPADGARGMMFRRRRIFAHLREGFTYDEIAAED
jgi:hypothetical protein